MGSDSFTIHSDGVIERGNELEPILLNILEVGSHRMDPLSAYKAQRKCFKIAKKEREMDYKEYVERLQLDHYPSEFKKAELGRRLFILLYLTSFVLLFGLLLFAIGIDWGFDDDGLGIGLIGLLLLTLAGLGIWRMAILVKKIKEPYNV